MCFFYFGKKFWTHLVIFCKKLLENCIQVIDTFKFAVYWIGWLCQALDDICNIVALEPNKGKELSRSSIYLRM